MNMKFGYKVLSSAHCILEEEWRTFQRNTMLLL